MPDQNDLEKAIAAIRAGDTATGQRLLVAILKTNPKNELAWLWLAHALPDDPKRMAALEQCLKVNPDSEAARRALEQLRQHPSKPKPPAASTAAPPQQVMPEPTRQAPAAAVKSSPSLTPLSDRLAGRGKPTGPLPSLNQIGVESMVQQPAAKEVAKPARSKGTGKEKRKPRHAKRRSFGLLEIGLVLMILAAVSALVFVIYYLRNPTQPDLAQQSRLGTAAVLETQNAGLRSQLAERQTQTAAMPQTNPTVTLTATVRPTQTLTPTAMPEVGVINVENVNTLAVRAELPGEFFTDLAYSPDGTYLAATTSNSLSIWNASQLDLAHQYPLEKRADALAFSPDEETLFFSQAGDGNESYLFRIAVKNWEALPTGARSTNPIKKLVFARDPQTLVTVLMADQDNLHFINTETYAVEAAQSHAGGILSIAVDPNTGFFATGGYAGTVQVVDLLSRQVVADLGGSIVDITALAFSPDGKVLITGAQDGEIRLWDTASWQLMDRFPAHTAAVKSLVFSPDPMLLVSGGDDGQMKAWDFTTMEPVDTFSAPIGLVDVVFSPDGQQLAAAGESSLVVWELQTP